MSDKLRLLKDVFECMYCNSLGIAFAQRETGRFYRFPPFIGASKGSSQILFIGTNPRISDSNETLHQIVSGHFGAFADLSNNLYQGQSYIGLYGNERHYKWHAKMVNKLFPERKFEDVAATTEIFFCASNSANGLSSESPCANKFMARVFSLTRPRLTIAVGKVAESYLHKFRIVKGPILSIRIGNHESYMLSVPHPNFHGERITRWRVATTKAKELLGEIQASHRPSEVMRTQVCEWHNRYGWKPFQKPTDLDFIESIPGSKMEFFLTRDGRKEFVLSMTAEQWKNALGDYYRGPNWRKNGYSTMLTRTRNGLPTTDFKDAWMPCIFKC